MKAIWMLPDFFNILIPNTRKRSDGMGVNLSVEAQYSYSQDLSLFVEAGFLTQPFGGTLNVTTLQFGPIMYFTVGAAL